MKNFFNSVNNVTQSRLSETVNLLYKILDNRGHIDGKVLRRLTSLVLYQGRYSEGIISNQEASVFFEKHYEEICLMEPMLGEYLAAWVEQNESALTSIRQKLLRFSIESQQFRAQRYIHTAAIDLRDWETAVMLHSKFSQTIKGLEYSSDVPGSERTLRSLRAKLERSFLQCTDQEELEALVAVLKQPYVLHNKPKVNHVLRHFLGDFRGTSQGRDLRTMHWGQVPFYGLSARNPFHHISERRRALFAALSQELISELVHSLPKLHADAVILACRALGHASLTSEHIEAIKDFAVQRQNPDAAVLVLFNKGFSRQLSSEEQPSYHMDEALSTYADLKILLPICLEQESTSVCQVELPVLAMSKIPQLFFDLLPGLIKQGREELVIQTLQHCSSDVLQQNFDVLMQTFLTYSPTSALLNRELSSLLTVHCQANLQTMSVESLLSYVGLKAAHPTESERLSVLSNRSLSAPFDKTLLQWLEHHASDKNVLAFDQYLARFTTNELELHGKVLISLVFSERPILVQRFDSWQSTLKSLFPDFVEEVVYSWLELKDARFLKHAKRFIPSQSEPNAFQTSLQELLSSPTEKLFGCLSNLVQRSNAEVVDVTFDIIEQVNRAALLSSPLAAVLISAGQTSERIAKVLSWIQEAMLQANPDAMLLFKDLVSRRMIQKIAAILENVPLEIWNLWFDATEHAEDMLESDYKTGTKWLIAKLLNRFSHAKVLHMIQQPVKNLLVEPHESIQKQLRPFLANMANHNVVELSEGIARVLRSERNLHVLWEHLGQVPTIQPATQTQLQPTILDLAGRAVTLNSALTDIVEAYLLMVPYEDLQTDARLNPVLQSSRQSMLEYGYGWLESHAASHPSFMGNLFFEQLRYTTADTTRHAMHQDLLAKMAEQHHSVLTSQAHEQCRAELISMVETFVLDWTAAKNAANQVMTRVVLALLAHMSVSELQTAFKDSVFQLITAPVHNPKETLEPVVIKLVTEDLAAERAIYFVTFVEESTFESSEQESFALYLIDTLFKEPLVKLIAVAPAEYLTQVQQLLSSRKHIIQDLGVTLLGLFPASVIVGNIKFTKWLLLDGPDRTLNAVIQYLQECNEELNRDWTELCREVVGALTLRRSDDRFENIWGQLFDLFDVALTSIANTDYSTFSEWVSNQEKRAPLSDLHLNLFSKLSASQRQAFPNTLLRVLSIEEPAVFETNIHLLEGFDGLDDIFDALMITAKRPRFLRLQIANLKKFVAMYKSAFQVYLTLHISELIDMVSRLIPTHTNNQKLLEVVFSVLDASVVQGRSALLQKLQLNPHMSTVGGYMSFMESVYTPDFVAKEFDNFMRVVRQVVSKNNDALFANTASLLKTCVVPAMVTEANLPTSPQSLDAVVATLGMNDSLDESLLELLSANPDASLLPLTKFHDLLLRGTTPSLRVHAPTILKSLKTHDSDFGQQLSKTVLQGLRTFSKHVIAEHVVSLLNDVLYEDLLENQRSNPQQGIKFIAETLLNLPNELYHEFGMKLFAELPIQDLKIHGQYVLLEAFDHKSEGVRKGVEAVYQKIWVDDVDWAMTLLVRLLIQLLPKARRPELFNLLEAYVDRITLVTDGSMHQRFQELLLEKSSDVGSVVKDLLLKPNAADSSLTKLRFDLGVRLVGKLPAEIFSAHLDLIVFLVLNHETGLQAIGEALVQDNLTQGGDAFRTRLGNALMQELKSDQKFVAEGANIFNFHFYPQDPNNMPTNLNGYVLERKKHTFPDFDGGLLEAPGNPNILIGPQVDDRNVKAPIGFPFQYCDKTYGHCTVDSNGWLRFEGSFSGSTYSNSTSYQRNTASMLFIWWQDLRTAHDGYLRTWMTGEQGRRVRVFEWRVWAVYTQSKSDNRTLNLQICLYEGSNKIEYRFGALEPRGKTNQSRTATCGAKVSTNRTSVGNFRDFFGKHGNPVGSSSPFRGDLKSDGKASSIDYPGVIRDAVAEARFDKQVLARYKKVMALLEAHCQSVLSTLDLNEVSHLIHHPKVEIRQFGGRVISGHSLPVDSFPSSLLFELLLVQDKDLQKVRDVVFSKLTIVGRQHHRGLWLNLIVHSVDSLQKIGLDNLQTVLDYDKTHHLDILKRLFQTCNAKVAGQLFAGHQKAIFERAVNEVPLESVVQEHELLQKAYFSIHPEMMTYFRDHVKSAIRLSKTMAFAVWDRLLQFQNDGGIAATHTEDLPQITKLIEVHIAQTQPDDLRDEDWWVPRLLSPNDTVQATLGVLLGTYVRGVPRRASEIAGDILQSMDAQVRGFLSAEDVEIIPYDILRGRVALEAFCKEFPAAEEIKFTHFWLRMFMHLHPEVRTRGEKKLLEQLTDGASEFNSKIVLNALIRQLRRDEVYFGAYDSVIAFITRNIASRLHLIEARLLKNLLDSRNHKVCDFALVLMRQKYSPDRVTMNQVIELGNHEYVEVRKYAHELMLAKVDALLQDFSVLVSLLESDWEDTSDAAWNIVADHMSGHLSLENIIRVCDSVKTSVRDRGLGTLQEFLLGTKSENPSWHTADPAMLEEMARRLAQHPTMDVEAFLMKLFEEHDAAAAAPLFGHPEQLTMLIPCFKRIFARVNKGRLVKTKLWELLEERALQSAANAAALYGLLYWIAGSHLKTDQFKSIALLTRIQQQYGDLSLNDEEKRLRLSPLRTENSNPIEAK